MLRDGLARPTLARSRVWEQSSSLQSLERCGPKAVALYQYWNARRGVRPMPTRADIDPLEMRQWLPRLTLVDVGPGGQFTYRLVGTQMVELLGMNPTGRSVESAWPEELAPRVLGSYRDVVESRGPIFCQQFNGWLDDQEPTAWSMRLPLSSDGVEVDMIMAYLSSNIGMLSQL
ncbi:PAS domain-containing protein [Dongia deserti]|uniref:PAS domain-containing protein n=1 Tax=Dongia deserti TaxID=2268030 RepID=UPI000E650F44|nr:PAS domain-containing protein [Dongia deserti]